MISLSLDEVRELAPGRLRVAPSAADVRGLQTDSRRVEPGDLFVAVGGGAEFLDDALGRGAAAALVPDDAFAALAALAGRVRDLSSARFVAITGSMGKTSTKDILAAICAPQRRTIAAERSYNAEIGVPLTIGRVERDTELCILELAMRGFGQIAELCAFARPAGRRDHERRPGPSGARRRPRRRRPRQGRADRRPSGRRDGDRAGGLPGRARRPRGRSRRSRRHPRSVRATRAAHLPRHRRGRLHCAAPGRQRPHGVRDGRTRSVCDCRPSSTSRSPPGGTRRSRSRAEACSSTTPGTRIPSRCAQRSSTSSSSRTADARSPCWGTWPSWAPTATRVTARSAARSSSWESTRCLRSDPRAAAYGGRHVDAVDEAIALLEEIVRPGDCVLVKAARAMGLERVAESLTRVTA